MDAEAFLDPRPSPPPPRPAVREWSVAAGQVAVGLGLLFGVARWVPARHPYLTGWVGMVGLVTALHFGAFRLLSCGWRSAGVVARPLMERPLAAASVSEFWGRRWNMAFRDLAHRFLFRPLTPRLGPRAALLVGFAASGLVHDLLVSVPAGAGYGGPTLFFLVQGAALLAERHPLGRRLGLGAGWRGRLFTAFALLAPVGALFHPPFVLAVILPFLAAVGAI
jgi:hypothetical protein